MLLRGETCSLNPPGQCPANLPKFAHCQQKSPIHAAKWPGQQSLDVRKTKHREVQIFAENCRKPQTTANCRMSARLVPFNTALSYPCNNKYYILNLIPKFWCIEKCGAIKIIPWRKLWCNICTLNLGPHALPFSRVQLFGLQLVSLEVSCLQLSFLLTMVFGSFFAYNWSVFTYSLSFLLSVEFFFSYSGKVYLISTSVNCQQNNSTASKEIPTVSKTTSP